ncbi:MAG: hypothetical protein QW423_01935 [Candidatus Aenigmatarchaeota archaeon]
MTLKLKDLEELRNVLIEKGYEEKVPATVLEKEIGKKFGISSYVITNIKQNLSKWNIMKPIDPFWWKIIKEENRNGTQSTV